MENFTKSDNKARLAILTYRNSSVAGGGEYPSGVDFRYGKNKFRPFGRYSNVVAKRVTGGSCH